jgi:nucleoid-associated protein YgaU
VTEKKPRQQDNSPKPKASGQTYTVKSGDCLWNIAKKFYGNGSQWEKIYSANTSVCGKPYKKGGTTYVMIHPGDVLNIPA